MFQDTRRAGLEFLQELADDVTFSSSVTDANLRGRIQVQQSISAVVVHLHLVKSRLQVTPGGWEVSVYSAVLESGQALECTFFCGRNAKGEISKVIMGLSPHVAVKALAYSITTDGSVSSSAREPLLPKLLSYANWLSS